MEGFIPLAANHRECQKEQSSLAMGAFAVVVVGVIAIIGLIQIVHDRIRESRRLDDITLEGPAEIESDHTEDTGRSR